MIYKLIKEIYRFILRILPDKIAIYLIYFRGYRKILNLRNPQYFGEKIQWLKLYGQLEKLSIYVDKYEVRKFVSETIGNQYLNTLYGVYNNPEDIDFSKLPNEFVLKSTNGSGYNIIVRDKSLLDIEKTIKMMNRWMKDDFSKMKKEPQYKFVKNRIIVEEYLEDDTGELRDYKFYCYNGEPYYYCVLSNRFSNKTLDIYDISGCKLEGITNGGFKNSSEIIVPPPNFQELVAIVKKLSEKFQFVRVDFYIANDRFYFGELTFTDGAGAEAFSPLEFDLEMAKRIKLGKVLVDDCIA